MEIDKKYRTGLVIGKFYPPHKGHKFLVETALRWADKVDVIVCFKKGESIPGELRAKWMREMHPGANIILAEDDLTDKLLGASPEEASKKWAEYTLKLIGRAPDAVFTSEEYGERYARFLGSKNILVDIDRKRFPVSGTKVRDNPIANWDYLEPPVKAYFAKRIMR